MAFLWQFIIYVGKLMLTLDSDSLRGTSLKLANTMKIAISCLTSKSCLQLALIQWTSMNKF